MHGELADTLLALAVVLVAAKVGGDLATRARQPAVLGELLAGIAMGAWPALDFVAKDANVELLAQLGVLVLLFEVGLESTVAQMTKVGASAFLVAALGVLAPFGLGWGAGAWLLPDASVYTHAFVGATLTATSIGITARVLQQLGRSATPEARIILGAAVIDDVLGLLILASVTAVIAAADTGGEVGWGALASSVLVAFVFLGGSLALGVALTPRVYRFLAHLRGPGVLLCASLAFCFGMAWLSARVGLAPIVGAFAAGLILEHAHFAPFRERGETTLEELVSPVAQFLAPVFFVVTGAKVDLVALADWRTLGLAAALTVAAIVGKQVCMFGVIARGVRRLPVGIGMIPRGEVGLIFAGVGATLVYDGMAVVDPSLYAAIVVMVLLTTLITPPALAWSLRRS